MEKNSKRKVDKTLAKSVRSPLAKKIVLGVTDRSPL